MDMNMHLNLSYLDIKTNQSSFLTPLSEDSIHLKSYMNMVSQKRIFIDFLHPMRIYERKYIDIHGKSNKEIVNILIILFLRFLWDLIFSGRISTKKEVIQSSNFDHIEDECVCLFCLYFFFWGVDWGDSFWKDNIKSEKRDKY